MFDLEVILLYPWAVNFKGLVQENGSALASMAIFIGVLLLVFFYAVGKGVIVWHKNPTPQER